MAISSRRFDQVFVTAVSGLLIAGSSLLILSGPPSDPRGHMAMVPAPDGGLSSQVTDPGSDAADALVPENSQLPTEFISSNSTGKPPQLLVEPVTIRRVPVGDSEIESAWMQASSDACEFIPPNEPFEISRPIPFLTNNDRRQAARRRPIPAIRQHVLSVGLQMSRQEEQSLPALGRSSITDYIHRHYVTIQARIQHEPVSGLVYLHHRPLAATMQFSGSRLTQEFTETVGKSMHDFRGLGIWLNPDEEVRPENLRTLVLAHRYMASQLGVTQTRAKPVYELMFIRARSRNENARRGHRTRTSSSNEFKDDSTGDLQLHTFVTTKGRRLLHHIASDTSLHSSQQCGINAMIEFTAFAHGAYPTESVVVDIPVRSSATFSKEKLDRFAQQQGWTGGFEHLSQLLDAIINREIPSD